MPDVVYFAKTDISSIDSELNRLESGLHHLENVPGISSEHLATVKVLRTQLDSLNDKVTHVVRGASEGSDFADEFKRVVDDVIEQAENVLGIYEPDKQAQNWPKARVCLRRSWGNPTPEPLQLKDVSDADILAEVQRRMQDSGVPGGG